MCDCQCLERFIDVVTFFKSHECVAVDVWNVPFYVMFLCHLWFFKALTPTWTQTSCVFVHVNDMVMFGSKQEDVVCRTRPFSLHDAWKHNPCDVDRTFLSHVFHHAISTHRTILWDIIQKGAELYTCCIFYTASGDYDCDRSICHFFCPLKNYFLGTASSFI